MNLGALFTFNSYDLFICWDLSDFLKKIYLQNTIN